MKPILITFISLFIFSSCTNDDDNNVQKEIPINYYFSVSSVLDAETEEEKIVEFEIDGIKHIDIAPCSWSYRKFTTEKETHIKVKTNSPRARGGIYEIRKNQIYNDGGYLTDPGSYITSGNFIENLDTVVKIK